VVQMQKHWHRCRRFVSGSQVREERLKMEGCSGCCCHWFCSCVFRREGGDETAVVVAVRRSAMEARQFASRRCGSFHGCCVRKKNSRWPFAPAAFSDVCSQWRQRDSRWLQWLWWRKALKWWFGDVACAGAWWHCCCCCGVRRKLREWW